MINFYDQILSLPIDTRTECFKIAERAMSDMYPVYSTDDVWQYIFYRCYNLHPDDFLSWAGLLQDHNLFDQSLLKIQD
jgi:hypothetical protein